MSLNLTPLDNESRLLVEATLKVASGGGGRFQPTGFPDLGPALYKGADGQTDWLLVESPQSMANRLELACWDEAAECYDEVCNGIPFVRCEVSLDGHQRATSTVQESHRLASPYILDGTLVDNGQAKKLWQLLKSNAGPLSMGLEDDRPFLLRNHAGQLFRFDPGCLLHGVWLSTKVDGIGRNKKAICGGKVRFPRIVSGHIEAKNPRQANSGGVKRERIFDQAESGTTDAEAGFGSIPFPRTEFTSPEIRAYFSLDLQILRTCALGQRTEQVNNGMTTRRPSSCVLNAKQGNFTNEEAFLIVWTSYKIHRFLAAGMTLRSGCAFELTSLTVTPSGFSWPLFDEVKTALGILKNSLFPLTQTQGEQQAAMNDWRRRNVAIVTWQGTPPPPVADTQSGTTVTEETIDPAADADTV